MKRVRFRHVLMGIFAFALAPELLSALRWAVPVTLSVGTAPTLNALAANLLAVVINAALIYGVFCLVRAVWHRRAQGRS